MFNDDLKGSLSRVRKNLDLHKFAALRVIITAGCDYFCHLLFHNPTEVSVLIVPFCREFKVLAIDKIKKGLTHCTNP